MEKVNYRSTDLFGNQLNYSKRLDLRDCFRDNKKGKYRHINNWIITG